MANAYLSLGSNEGARESWLGKAIVLIEARCGPVIKKSSVYETAAWGITTQPDFLNMVICVQTSLMPEQLLHSILNIETTLGRHRDIKWGPRIIDIDILFYDNTIINTEGLVIPHPFLQERRFTLVPLAEIAPLLIHPVFNKSVAQLLKDCTDQLNIWKYN